MSLFQSNLRKEIRILPKFRCENNSLLLVFIISHYHSFVSLLDTHRERPRPVPAELEPRIERLPRDRWEGFTGRCLCHGLVRRVVPDLEEILGAENPAPVVVELRPEVGRAAAAAEGTAEHELWNELVHPPVAARRTRRLPVDVVVDVVRALVGRFDIEPFSDFSAK